MKIPHLAPLLAVTLLATATFAQSRRNPDAAPSGSALLGLPAIDNPAPPPAPGPRIVRGSLYRATAITAPHVAGEDSPPPPSASFTAVTPQQPRKYKKNDLVTIVIREDSDSSSTGKGQSKKKTEFDLALEQFFQLSLSSSGLPEISDVSEPSKLPEIKFKYNHDRTNDASQNRKDSFTARVTATVIDVKPNGNLVLEATKKITVDREIQLFRLSGTCRAADITPDNTVLSTQVAELALGKFTEGEVRDGTKAGWLGRFIDKFSPF